jgi:hypothetical protein
MPIATSGGYRNGMEDKKIDVGCGLWARCEEPLESRFLQLIQDFSRRFGGPSFPPHLTLATHFGDPDEALRAAEAAAAALGRTQLRFETAEATADYHRALYVRAAEHPGLSACYTELVRRSGKEQGAFLPHVSLAYGELGQHRDTALREAQALLPLDAPLRAIEVWQLRGASKDWRRCAAVQLPTA